MPERVRAWLEDFAHIFTIVSALVILGVGSGLAVIIQAVVGALVALSPFERVLLGACAFLVILGIGIVVLKRVSGKQPAANLTTESEELRGARERLERAAYQAKQENDSLRKRVQELEMVSPEEYRIRQEERRKQIKKWREEINAHTFHRHPLGGSWFVQTETYLEMQARLPRKIRDRFEGRTIAAASFLGPVHFRGTEGDRRILLREVARIEEEWGVL